MMRRWSDDCAVSYSHRLTLLSVRRFANSFLFHLDEELGRLGRVLGVRVVLRGFGDEEQLSHDVLADYVVEHGLQEGVAADGELELVAVPHDHAAAIHRRHGHLEFVAKGAAHAEPLGRVEELEAIDDLQRPALVRHEESAAQQKREAVCARDVLHGVRLLRLDILEHLDARRGRLELLARHLERLEELAVHDFHVGRQSHRPQYIH
uniref:Uncharacterized protein n=1 Tax=Rhipicephalus zambeziensis TaxID=60191 RepID=A0A224Y5Q7_9ACAR